MNSVRLVWLVCVSTGLGLAVALSLVVFDLVVQRPLPHAGWLLIPGILVLGSAQLWATFVLRARVGGRGPGWIRPGSSLRDLWVAQREMLFRGRGRTLSNALLVILGFAFLSFVAASPDLTSAGQPSPSATAPQRAAASGFAMFFTLELGVAAGELMRRRRGSDRLAP